MRPLALLFGTFMGMFLGVCAIGIGYRDRFIAYTGLVGFVLFNTLAIVNIVEWKA